MMTEGAPMLEIRSQVSPGFVSYDVGFGEIA
jgi:hypothetical protein